jgi:hypothetical protein
VQSHTERRGYGESEEEEEEGGIRSEHEERTYDSSIDDLIMEGADVDSRVGDDDWIADGCDDRDSSSSSSSSRRHHEDTMAESGSDEENDENEEEEEMARGRGEGKRDEDGLDLDDIYNRSDNADEEEEEDEEASDAKGNSSYDLPSDYDNEDNDDNIEGADSKRHEDSDEDDEADEAAASRKPAMSMDSVTSQDNFDDTFRGDDDDDDDDDAAAKEEGRAGGGSSSVGAGDVSSESGEYLDDPFEAYDPDGAGASEYPSYNYGDLSVEMMGNLEEGASVVDTEIDAEEGEEISVTSESVSSVRGASLSVACQTDLLEERASPHIESNVEEEEEEETHDGSNGCVDFKYDQGTLTIRQPSSTNVRAAEKGAEKQTPTRPRQMDIFESLMTMPLVPQTQREPAPRPHDATSCNIMSEMKTISDIVKSVMSEDSARHAPWTANPGRRRKFVDAETDRISKAMMSSIKNCGGSVY